MGRLTTLLRTIQLALALLRREYAIQYAGMSLGLFWLLVQYMAQIGVFILVFGRGIYSEQGALAYSGRLLAGMLLWLPLSEMLGRSTTILSENRALIRRTTVGRDLFPHLPLLQAMLQYSILAIPVTVALAATGNLSRAPTVLTGLIFGWMILLLFSIWGVILARTAILLRDLGPVLRPILQGLFWLTPIAYYAAPWSVWNPLTWIFETHTRLLLASGPANPIASSTALYAFLTFAAGTIIAGASSFRLKRILEDHL